MKYFFIFIIFVSMCVSTYGQETYTGKLIVRGNPCITDPCLPCTALWLETASGNYLLDMCGGPLIFDGVVYPVGAEVEITGTVTVELDIWLEEYFVLKIETIKRFPSPTYTGKIICVESPYWMELWLETTSMNYQLTTFNSPFNLKCPTLIFDDVEYSEGDEVEITGIVDGHILIIETIKKTNDGVSYVPSSGLTAYSQDNGIVVQNVPEGESIAVYNPSGELIVTAVAGEDETYIPLPAKGVYMVKAAGVAMKVVL